MQNGGFEAGVAGWNLPEGMTRLDTERPHTGHNSLRFTNTDSATYKLITRKIAVQPGDIVHFSAWIRGENITSTSVGKGAGVFVESSDANGKWITGGYTNGYAGTFDWKQDTGTYGVPANAASVIVGLYLRKDSIGTAWFDDVEVRVSPQSDLKATILYPNYRGMTPVGNRTPWRVSLVPASDKLEGITNIPVQSQLMDERGRVLAQKAISFARQGPFVLEMAPPPGLPVGRYVWRVVAQTAPERTATFSFPIEIVNAMPSVYVDAAGFTMVNGKRFFPLGVFLGSTAEEHLKRVREAGFNTVLAYNNASPEASRAYLDAAQQHDLRVVFSLCTLYEGQHWAPKDVPDLHAFAGEYIRQLRDKPALLSWYTSDELGVEWLPKIQSRYEQIVGLDRDHPVYQVLLDPGLAAQYTPSADVLGTDPYPVGKGTDLQRTSGYTRVLSAASGTAKGVWMVPQIFDWGVYPKESTSSHPPSLDEMRNQAYQALIHGAKGLIFYSYFDLWYEAGTRVSRQSEFDKRWPDVLALSREMQGVLPVILEGSDVSAKVLGPSRVEVRALQRGDDLVVLAANPYYEPASVTMIIPAGWLPVEMLQGEVASEFANGRLTLKLGSVGSGMFRLVKRKGLG